MHKLTTTATLNTTANGASISRRRNRNTAPNNYDSHDETAPETLENSRIRDRFRDRSARKQPQQLRRRRSGDRILRTIDDDEEEDDDNSSDETIDDDYENENEVSDRYNQQHSSSSPSQRKNFATGTTSWRTNDIVGAAVPRKARSGLKRSSGSWVSGGAGIGAIRDEQFSRQSSASPSRMSPAPQVSSSSNAPSRKKLKPISGGGKLRPPKSSKPPASSLVQDELEVAEVLFGLTRQFQASVKQDGQKTDDEFRNESKSGAVSPDSSVAGNSSAVPPMNSTLNQVHPAAIAPKRKRPRKVEEGSPTSSIGAPSLQNASISHSDKMEQEKYPKTEAASLPKSEKKNDLLNTHNADFSPNISIPMDEDVKFDESTERNVDLKFLTMKSEQLEGKGESLFTVKEDNGFNLGVEEETTAKSSVLKDKSMEVKFTIDLMALPSEKLSTDDENDQEPDQKAMDAASVVVSNFEAKIEMERKDKQKLDVSLAERKGDKPVGESDCQKGKEIINKLKIDLEGADKDSIDGNKDHIQNPPKALDLESKQPDKSSQNTSPLTPLTASGWQGNFPPFGYTGQVPHVQVVVPPDTSSGSSTILQPPGFLSAQPRPKRCATHCYIAQKIHYHQHLLRANPIWSAAAAAAAAAGTIPLYGAKQLGPNGIPPSDAALLGNAVQGNFLATNVGSPKDKHEPSRATVAGQPAVGSAVIEGIEKKPFVVPQFLQSVPGSNMLSGPTFIFPVNQQQDVASMATAVSGASKSTPPNSNSAPVSGSTSMNLSFAGLAPNDAQAQYLAIVQNGGYPFPFPANIASASQQYRGLTPAGPIPFFNPPFYSSQVLHPSQIQQQVAMTSHPVPPHQGYQSANNSIGSSSSKHPQLAQQTLGTGPTSTAGTSHGPAENEKGTSSSQAQKNSFNQKFAISMQMPTVNPSAAIGGGPGAQTDKQSWNHQFQTQQKQASRVEMSSPQVFAMPFGGMANLPPGLDFSSMAQSGIVLQNLPEPFRKQYSNLNIPASSATAYESQQKTQNHNVDDGASVSKDVRTANGKSEDDSRKTQSTSGKTLGSQHTLTFCRTDEPAMSSILNSNAVDSSSRTMNLMANHSASATVATTAGASTTMNLSNTHQAIQLQKMQQKQLMMQNQHPSSHSKISSSNNSSTMYNDRLPQNLHGTKFPQPLAGFPQSTVQGGGANGSSLTQSPQWKVNARSATVPSGTAASQSVVKNNVLQQQGRPTQQQIPSHQNLMSFGANLMKAVPAGLQQHPMPTSNQASANITNTHNSGLKGPPIAAQGSSSAKPGASASIASAPQQSSSPKISSSNSNSKSSSPLVNREPVAVTSQRNATPTSTSGTRLQHQLPQQVPQQSQKQPQHSQTQIIFTNGFMPQAQYAQPNIAARFYQPRPPEQSQQQNSPAGGSTNVTESAAAVSGNSSNGLPSPGLVHAAQLAAAARASSLVPATFPYMTAPTVSAKATSDQKPAVRPEKKAADGKR